MKKNSKKYDLLLAFGINILVFLIYYFFFGFFHESNDDLGISFLMEGAYGEYSEYVVYQNFLWAKLVIAFNQLIPQVKWYMVLMYIGMFANFVGITYTFLRAQGKKLGVLTSAIMLMFCGYHSYVIFQYSRIAAVVTVGGLVLLFFALEYAEDKKEKWIALVCGTMLCLWGSMLRFQMFALAVVLGGGVIGLYKVFVIIKERKENWLKQIGTYVAVFGMVGVLSVGLYVVDMLHYTQDEYWNSFKEFNEVRTELWDYGFPDYYQNAQLYNELGINESDYIFHIQWNMDDYLTTETLTKLVEAKEEKTFSLSGFLSEFPDKFMSNSLYLAYLVLAVAAIALNRKNIYFAAYGFCGVMAFEAYFYYTGRYGMDRIDCGMWMVAIITLIYGMSKELAEFKLQNWKWVVAVVAMAAILNISYIDQNPHPLRNYVASTKTLYEQISADKEHLYICTATAPYVYFGFDFWEPCEVGELSNIYNAYGWEQRVEVKEQILENYNVSNIYRDSINNEKIYFITGQGQSAVLLQNYIMENYNENAALAPVQEIAGYTVWSIKTNE